MVKIFKFMKKNIDLFVNSLDLRRYSLGLAIDFLVVSIIFVISYFSAARIQQLLHRIEEISSLFNVSGDLPNSMIAELEMFFVNIFGIIFVSIILTILLISISRVYLFRKLLNVKSPSEALKRKLFRYMKHFFVSILGFIFFIVLPFVFISINVDSIAQIYANPARFRALVLITALFLFIYQHISFVFNNIFARNPKILKSISDTFNIGILNMGFYVVPYLMLFLIFIVLSFFVSLTRFFVPFRPYLFIVGIFFILIVPLFRLFLMKLTSLLYKKYSKN